MLDLLWGEFEGARIVLYKLSNYTKDPYLLDLFPNGLQLNLKEIPSQQGGGYHLSGKVRYHFTELSLKENLHW